MSFIKQGRASLVSRSSTLKSSHMRGDFNGRIGMLSRIPLTVLWLGLGEKSGEGKGGAAIFHSAPNALCGEPRIIASISSIFKLKSSLNIANMQFSPAPVALVLASQPVAWPSELPRSNEAPDGLVITVAEILAHILEHSISRWQHGWCLGIGALSSSPAEDVVPIL
jgi:hypothetical protein